MPAGIGAGPRHAPHLIQARISSLSKRHLERRARESHRKVEQLATQFAAAQRRLLADGGKRRLDTPRMRGDPLSNGRSNGAEPTAVEESYTELVLNLSDGSRDRRLRYAELQRGLVEACRARVPRSTRASSGASWQKYGDGTRRSSDATFLEPAESMRHQIQEVRGAPTVPAAVPLTTP